VRHVLFALPLLLALVGCRVEEPAIGPDGEAQRRVAPAFEIEALDGSTVRLEDFRGRSVVIDFWATWCAPCVFQIPVLNAYQAAHPDVVVLGVAVDVDGREAVAPFAEEHGIAYPVLLGDEGLAQAYEALGFPSLYVLTPDLEIDSVHVGIVDGAGLAEAVRAARGS